MEKVETLILARKRSNLCLSTGQEDMLVFNLVVTISRHSFAVVKVIIHLQIEVSKDNRIHEIQKTIL